MRAVKIEAGREARAGDVLHRQRVLMIDASGIAEQGQLDEGAVASAEIDVSAEGATVRTLVIPTNEELMIALDTAELAK